MKIRNACKRDMKYIISLFDKYEFNLDVKHLKRLIVSVDEEDKIIGVLYLNTVLECSFLANENLSKRSRIVALKLLVSQGIKEVKRLDFDGTHAFANEKIAKILKKHFNFQTGKGENLFLFVE